MAVPMACRKGHPVHSSAIRKHTPISAPCLESKSHFPFECTLMPRQQPKIAATSPITAVTRPQLHLPSQELSNKARERGHNSGITAITSSTCQKHAELPELSGRHVDRPKPKKLADSNAAFVWTLYTCAVVDSRSPKGWHNHLVKVRARSPLPHRRWWFLKRR